MMKSWSTLSSTSPSSSCLISSSNRVEQNLLSLLACCTHCLKKCPGRSQKADRNVNGESLHLCYLLGDVTSWLLPVHRLACNGRRCHNWENVTPINHIFRYRCKRYGHVSLHFFRVHPFDFHSAAKNPRDFFFHNTPTKNIDIGILCIVPSILKEIK